MEYEFKSLRELYDRITPALRTKKNELVKIWYSVKEADIWNYLTDKKWQKSVSLTISEMVEDIFNTTGEEVTNHMIKKLSDEMREPYFEE